MNISKSHQIIIDELDSRGWSYSWFSKKPYILSINVPTVEKSVEITPLMSRFVSGIGEVCSKKKLLSYELLQDSNVQIPAFIKYTTMEKAEEFLLKHKQIVVKPNNLSHGIGVTVGITTTPKLKSAIEGLVDKTNRIILQKQVKGHDIRLLFIGDKYVGAVSRTPAAVTGDGLNSIAKLIDAENNSGTRGTNYNKDLNIIDTTASKRYLGDGAQRVPEKGEWVQVVGAVNLGAGGGYSVITDNVVPETVELARRIKDTTQTTHAGVDFMTENYSLPPSIDNPMYFIETNSRPYLGFHQTKDCDVAKIYVDWLESRAIKENTR